MVPQTLRSLSPARDPRAAAGGVSEAVEGAVTPPAPSHAWTQLQRSPAAFPLPRSPSQAEPDNGKSTCPARAALQPPQAALPGPGGSVRPQPQLEASPQPPGASAAAAAGDGPRGLRRPAAALGPRRRLSGEEPRARHHPGDLRPAGDGAAGGARRALVLLVSAARVAPPALLAEPGPARALPRHLGQFRRLREPAAPSHALRDPAPLRGRCPARAARLGHTRGSQRREPVPCPRGSWGGQRPGTRGGLGGGAAGRLLGVRAGGHGAPERRRGGCPAGLGAPARWARVLPGTPEARGASPAEGSARSRTRPATPGPAWLLAPCQGPPPLLPRTRPGPAAPPAGHSFGQDLKWDEICGRLFLGLSGQRGQAALTEVITVIRVITLTSCFAAAGARGLSPQ